MMMYVYAPVLWVVEDDVMGMLTEEAAGGKGGATTDETLILGEDT